MRYFESGQWPEYSDGGGASLFLSLPDFVQCMTESAVRDEVVQQVLAMFTGPADGLDDAGSEIDGAQAVVSDIADQQAAPSGFDRNAVWLTQLRS